MKHAAAAMAILAAAAGTAGAQEERGPRQDFERRMRELEERFRAQKDQLEREFRERLQPRRTEPRGEHDGVHALLQRVLERLDRLERKLDEVRPKFEFDFKDLERRFHGARPPKLDFDFERFVPQFRRFFDKDGDFDFEFRLHPRGKDKAEPEKKAEKDDRKKHQKKPGRKDRDDEDDDERPRTAPRPDRF